MNEALQPHCPECDGTVEPAPTFDRRNFIRVLGGGVAALAATATGAPRLRADQAPAPKVKPAETLIHELYASLSETQKNTVVLPWDHGRGAIPSRLGMYNSPLLNQSIGQIYTKPQQELIRNILRSILASDEAFRRISRNNTWDQRGGFEGCGCHLFGEPVPGKRFAWLITGHHLTLRCDPDLKDGIAWGGPMYYGHSAGGYSSANVYNYQTQSVLKVYRALDEKQRAKALLTGSPGEQAASVRFRKPEEAKPGIAAAELNAEQKALVEQVMRDILAPYRKEDGDEVMAIIKNTGGLEKIHLAFYRDRGATDNERWHFWRLEGPGFVWNYRVLPHVHCYVNIAGGVG